MKKILVASTLALVLTGCANKVEDKSKRVEEVFSSKGSTEVTSQSSSSKSSTTITQESTKIDAVTTISSKEIRSIDIDVENIRRIFNLYNVSGESVEKLISVTGKKYHIEGSEYITSSVSTISDVTDAYNAIQEKSFTKEEILSEIKKNAVLEVIDDTFNVEDIRKIFAKDPENVVVYFKKDGKLFLGMKEIFHGGPGNIANQSEWLISEEEIKVPVKSFTGEKLFNLVYAKNTKNLVNKSNVYKYYIVKKENL